MLIPSRSRSAGEQPAVWLPLGARVEKRPGEARGEVDKVVSGRRQAYPLTILRAEGLSDLAQLREGRTGVSKYSGIKVVGERRRQAVFLASTCRVLTLQHLVRSADVVADGVSIPATALDLSCAPRLS